VEEEYIILRVIDETNSRTNSVAKHPLDALINAEKSELAYNSCWKS